MRERHYVNLTNGIEALDTMPDGQDVVFLRVQSSHCEAKRWDFVLGELSDDLLLHLAKGTTCIIHDRGARRDCPRALWQGMEIARYVLEREWFGREYPIRPDMRAYAERVRRSLPRRVRRKLRYYKAFLSTDELRLRYETRRAHHDGLRDWHAALLSLWYQKTSQLASMGRYGWPWYVWPFVPVPRGWQQ